jgi:hypothetical protein
MGMTGRQDQRHGEGWHGGDGWHEDYSQNHNPAPPTSAVSNCSQGGWGGARTRTRTGTGTGTGTGMGTGTGTGMGTGTGTGTEHTMCRGKTDDKDQTMETRGGPTTSGQGTRHRGHAHERVTNEG